MWSLLIWFSFSTNFPFFSSISNLTKRIKTNFSRSNTSRIWSDWQTKSFEKKSFVSSFPFWNVFLSDRLMRAQQTLSLDDFNHFIIHKNILIPRYPKSDLGLIRSRFNFYNVFCRLHQSWTNLYTGYPESGFCLTYSNARHTTPSIRHPIHNIQKY